MTEQEMYKINADRITTIKAICEQYLDCSITWGELVSKIAWVIFEGRM